MGASLSAAEGDVRVLYERSTLVLMQHTALMTDLEGLTLTLRSEVTSTFLVTVVDGDGARFQHTFDLAASERSCVSLLPSEFRLADDSPVRKDSLDPGLLRAGYVLADLGAAFGARGPNTLSVEEVLVRRTDLPVHRGDLVVEASVELKEPLFVEGSVVVRTGACLKIVERCGAVVWGVISCPGCRVDVTGSRLIAVGAWFEGDTEATISGLRNGAEMEDTLFPAGDRRVRFVKSSVQAWNLYAHGTARLTIDHCVFGECGSGDDALLRVIDSTCDGSGGFIGAGDRSRMEIEHSRITTLVSASGASTIVLTDCEIIGEVTASEDATISLVRCTVEGSVREIGNGKVIRK